jgi:hypothetical protein
MKWQGAKQANGMVRYQIEVRGRMDETDLNATSPLQITIVSVETTATEFTVDTDQSGLIGLIRHLHGRGISLLSIRCTQQPTSARNETLTRSRECQ